MTGDIPADFQLDDAGNPEIAPERFKDAGEIRDCCNQMLSADRQRGPWRASIDGLIDGNPAYRLSSLKAKGQGWRSRVNFREAEGLLDARKTPFYDLVTEVDPCVDLQLDYGAGTQQEEMANKIAKHFHWMLLTAWRSGFNFNISLQQMEMFKHGIGYHVWPGNKNCWIPRTPVTGHVLFPDGVSLNLREDLDYFMLRDFLPGYALHAFIRNPDVATKMGWNVSSVWDALLQSNKIRYGNSGERNYGLEQFQREMKSGDIGTTMSRQSGLWLNHLFVKEIETEEISQYTIAEGVSATNKKAFKTDDPFRDCLFRKRNRFDEWPLTIFPYCIGNGGLLHTTRGLGARTKDFFELSNRIKNAMADQVLVGSTLNVKQTGSVEPDKLRLLRLGMMSIIPQGLELIPGVQFPNLSQGPIALSQELNRTLSSNNESYGQGTPEPTDRETAQSYTMRTQNAGQAPKGAHALYASNYQMMLERIFKISARAEAAVGPSLSAKLTKMYHERCEKDGVPIEALSHVTEVNEVFSTGAGSPAARLDSLMKIWQLIYPTTTEPRKINIERDIVAAVTSSSKVDRYARNVNDTQIPDSDSSLAVQENNGLANGGDALVAPTQNHTEHLEQHLPKTSEIVQQIYAGQIPPAQGLAIIQKFGQHEAEHLKLLQQNPMRKAEFKQFHDQWLSLSVIADKLQQQVQAAAKAAPKEPPQQQISDRLQIGMADVASKERLGQAELASKSRLDLQRIAVDGRVKALSATLNARNGAGEKKAA